MNLNYIVNLCDVQCFNVVSGYYEKNVIRNKNNLFLLKKNKLFLFLKNVRV